MDKEVLRLLIDDWFTISKIAEHQKCSKTNVRYWLKKFNLKTKRGPRGKLPRDLNCSRKCKCGESDPNKFYGNKRDICSKCQNKYNTFRNKEKRVQALKHYGNKCMNCGYNKFDCALDFHHLNPEDKDINFSSAWGWSWPRLKKELDKCVLLCKNCHAAVHTGALGISGLESRRATRALEARGGKCNSCQPDQIK